MFRSFFLSRKWFLWSIAGSLIILAATWYKVQLDVKINEWFGSFYDVLQDALSSPGKVPLDDFNSHLFTFAEIAGIYIVVAVLLEYFARHYAFRWRTAMNDYYMSHWDELRHIEGAAQRVQDDTMRFASILEDLGTAFLHSILLLIAFLPILWDLSENVTELPWIGQVDQSMVWGAIVSAVLGTAFVAAAGYRLPRLYFNNQRVEAAYRKELVYGEDYKDRAQPETVKEFFANVRRNYFRLYLHYLYFDIARYSYLQATVILPYLMLGPTIVGTTITLGVVQQIVRAFSKVEDSFQYLVRSWSRIVELISIYNRLKAFEMAIGDKDTSQTTPPLYPGDGGGN